MTIVIKLSQKEIEDIIAEWAKTKHLQGDYDQIVVSLEVSDKSVEASCEFFEGF